MDRIQCGLMYLGDLDFMRTVDVSATGVFSSDGLGGMYTGNSSVLHGIV